MNNKLLLGVRLYDKGRYIDHRFAEVEFVEGYLDMAWYNAIFGDNSAIHDDKLAGKFFKFSQEFSFEWYEVSVQKSWHESEGYWDFDIEVLGLVSSKDGEE